MTALFYCCLCWSCCCVAGRARAYPIHRPNPGRWKSSPLRSQQPRLLPPRLLPQEPPAPPPAPTSASGSPPAASPCTATPAPRRTTAAGRGPRLCSWKQGMRRRASVPRMPTVAATGACRRTSATTRSTPTAREGAAAAALPRRPSPCRCGGRSTGRDSPRGTWWAAAWTSRRRRRVYDSWGGVWLIKRGPGILT